MKHGSYACTLLLLACMLLLQIPVRAQEAPIDIELAARYFAEAAEICRRDSGRLWGVSLCGPMIFVDSRTRTVVANHADPEGNLSRKEDVFMGRLPDAENVANTATTWAGVKWTMILWPLPTNKTTRARLMAHELCHRIQSEIGIPLSNPANDHLDSLKGRLWMKLEWRALRAALTLQGEERRNAVKDALIFRMYRQSQFPRAASEERALELNEGIAEYTGIKLMTTSELESVEYAAKQLEASESKPTFVRSFAYASGPAYGLLLDQSGMNWRERLKERNDFGLLLRTAFSIDLPKNLDEESQMRSAKYQAEALRASEQEREASRQKRTAEYRARLVEGPILIIPLTDKVNYSFNPNELQPLDDAGTVFPTMRMSDAWGVLTVSKGALVIRREGRVVRVQVPRPSDRLARPLVGDGWTLELQEGWKLQVGERPGDFLLRPSRE